ncbi:hypothetical protein D0T84_12220 [Dysgonomonas sp. 521]|uniref:DUF4350 domain-containing protein n=1 Tax=Dysgonomonas sp. 521 TaxID=2302932 RepID=UPI0013D2B961|nr:DUF4350 domain-containing protein [Dysgonomonas sp. 521]NDV95673.1 hypothetical protein [Dysgonomonas sp. 521]
MKDKKLIVIIAVIILLLVGLSYAQTKAPKAVDWRPTFINTKTAPYGTYIVYELLGDVFSKKNIRSTRRPIYNNLKKDMEEHFSYEEVPDSYGSGYYENNDDYGDYYEEDDDYDYDEADTISENITSEAGTTTDVDANTFDDPTGWYRDIDAAIDTTAYLFVNTKFSLDKVDLQYMLDFVGLGNNLFISSESFSSNLLDTLKIKVKRTYFEADTVYSLADFPDRKYNFTGISGEARLNTDSCKLKVRPLAFNSKNDTVFVEVQYGKGHIYLHTVPSAFANVNLLQTNKYDFAFRCLSYLPQNSKIIWDEYQKQGAVDDSDSIFRAMLKYPPLRIALYLILGGLLLFMIFRAKRTQRIIPVINPPVNSSLEFLGTISNLYYRKKDFRTIVEKRHAYFLDYIRKHYYMQTENINDEFLDVLSAKSGVERGKLNNLFILYRDMEILPYAPNEAFLKYNNLLEEFYRKVKSK